jgi:GNAT superfamily N-acetyltransferase
VIPVTTTYLEHTDPHGIVAPSRPAPAGFATRVVHDPAVNADLYRRVGGDWSWTDRLVWTDPQWARWADRAETHVIELDGATCGYFELLAESSGSVLVALFGLLPECHGRGLGGHALVAALRRGFELRPRVYLTTCTLDGPYALANYTARGMRVYRTETIAGGVVREARSVTRS